MKKKILDKIAAASLEELMDIDHIDSVDWIWVNRELYRDFFYNLQLDQEIDDDVIEAVLSEINDDEMYSALKQPFQQKGFVSVSQILFASFDKGYKPTKDIKTFIFVKGRYYRKLITVHFRELEWILKAMAIDTMIKMGTDYKSVKEAYQDLYEENTRILEDLLTNGSYEYLTAKWEYDAKSNQLYFYRSGEMFHEWNQNATLSRYAEYTRSK
ncbi:MAG: hypothetical protein ACOYVK_18490 [Bacillota bacterium]